MTLVREQQISLYKCHFNFWLFRWAKVRSKRRLKSKSEVVSLSQSLRQTFAQWKSQTKVSV